MHLFCSAYIKQISFDSGHPDKTVQTEKGLVEWNVGRAYCMEDEEFYREMLRTFLDAHSDAELRGYYEASDFENYRIKVHAIKTNLANIGAGRVSEMAMQLELALKLDKNETYVQEHHEEFMKLLEKVMSEVERYLEGGN